MRQAQRKLLAYLTKVKDRDIGFMGLGVETADKRISVQLDASFDLFTSKCLFDDCTDAEARFFLESFLTGEFSTYWEVDLQLAKLLATRGRLVSDIMDPLLTATDWGAFSNLPVFLSYLAVREDGADWAIRLLDVVPEDFRDGLFLACHRLRSEALDRRLISKFLEWEAGDWEAGATGELGALEQFIAKWIRLYPFQDLEGVVRVYFDHVREE